MWDARVNVSTRSTLRAHPVMQDLIKILHSHHNWLCFKAVLLITNQLKIKFVNFNMEQIKRFYCDYLKV